jgi:hypothetical protein
MTKPNTLKALQTTVIIMVVMSSLSLSLTSARADRSELSVGVAAGVMAPRDGLTTPELLGLRAPRLSAELLAQFGLSQSLNLGLSLGALEVPAQERRAALSAEPCELSEGCHSSAQLLSAQGGRAALRLSHIPYDQLSPLSWLELGGWRLSRAPSYELLRGGGSALRAAPLDPARWWGLSLELGLGVSWRFLSRWSMSAALELELPWVLNHRVPTAELIGLGGSILISYHSYLRIL